MNTTSLRLALLATAAVASAASANANLIVNGSFEDLGLGGALTRGSFPNTWDLFASIPGWTPDAGSPQIEIGRASTYGVTGQDLNNVMELDSTANVVVGQIFVASAGPLSLSFLAAQRSGISPASGQFDVLWNGASLTLTVGLTPDDTGMSPYVMGLTAIAGNNTLSFKGLGTSDSFGVLIDNVVVVPEPSTYVAGGLALLPLLFGLRSRFLKK